MLRMLVNEGIYFLITHVKEEITMEIRTYFEVNVHENV